jgi:hypothetical protein
MMSDAEIGPDGELLRRDAEGEIGFWGWHEEVENKDLAIHSAPPDVSQAIQFAMLDPDLREEDRQALISLAEAGLLGEGAEIVSPEQEYPQIIGQLALEGLESEYIDEPDEPEIPPEGDDTVIRDVSDGLEIVGVKIEKTDDGAEITL